MLSIHRIKSVTATAFAGGNWIDLTFTGGYNFDSPLVLTLHFHGDDPRPAITNLIAELQRIVTEASQVAKP